MQESNQLILILLVALLVSCGGLLGYVLRDKQPWRLCAIVTAFIVGSFVGAPPNSPDQVFLVVIALAALCGIIAGSFASPRPVEAEDVDDDVQEVEEPAPATSQSSAPPAAASALGSAAPSTEAGRDSEVALMSSRSGETVE